MAWIERHLQPTLTIGETVIGFLHSLLVPLNKHILWNGQALADLLCRYQVRAHFAGDDHRGGDCRRGNTDFMTLKGMLNGLENVSFAVEELEGKLFFTGYVGKISRILPL